MARPACQLPRRLLTLTAFLALCVPGPRAQQTAAQGAIQGLLRDEGGEAVAAATVTFVADADPDVPALRDLQLPAAPLRTTSDASGAFRLAAARPGLLLVTTASGLGAVVERVWPGRAVRVLLRPMAAVERRDGSEITVAACTFDRDGARRHLPPSRAVSPRLPAGRYEAWIHDRDGWSWLRLDLLPGQRHVLADAIAAAPIALPTASAVAPVGFPQLELGDAGRLQLCGEAAQAPLFAQIGGNGHRLGTVGDDAAGTLQVLVEPASDAEVHVLRRTRRGDWRVDARARLDGHGAATLPRPADDLDCWVLATAPGIAAVASPIAGPRDRAPMTLMFAAGRRLSITVRDASGEPIADTAVTFACGADGPRTAIAYTDELGRASLGPVAGPGVVAVEDARYRRAAVGVDAEEAPPIALVLEPGLALRGRVTLPDGAPIAGAAVVLRDPAGHMRPIERATASGSNGEFEFNGLDDSRPLVLFASVTRAGHTCSGRATVRGGQSSVLLLLRDEDPELRPPSAK